MMDGGIDLQSVSGKGTLVTVTLKLAMLAAIAPHTTRHRERRDRHGALNIMIVDDNPAGRMVLSQQLSVLGHRVACFDSPQQALVSLETARPDAVLSDCNMPEMSGYAFTRTIHARYPGLPVFGLTADAREAVRDEAQKAGMSDCLFKPVTLSMLETLLAPVFPSANPALPEKPPTPVPEFHLPSVLQDGEHLATFLTLQIAVLDETLAEISQWYDTPHISLQKSLHKLRGGIQLLGATALEAQCLEQEQNPDEQGIRQLEAAMRSLRAALQQWHDVGLHSYQHVLQQDEEGFTSS